VHRARYSVEEVREYKAKPGFLRYFVTEMGLSKKQALAKWSASLRDPSIVKGQTGDGQITVPVEMPVRVVSATETIAAACHQQAEDPMSDEEQGPNIKFIKDRLPEIEQLAQTEANARFAVGASARAEKVDYLRDGIEDKKRGANGDDLPGCDSTLVDCRSATVSFSKKLLRVHTVSKAL
jgi:hypothetical protein